jgi:hypothetical protein
MLSRLLDCRQQPLTSGCLTLLPGSNCRPTGDANNEQCMYLYGICMVSVWYLYVSMYLCLYLCVYLYLFVNLHLYLCLYLILYL